MQVTFWWIESAVSFSFRHEVQKMFAKLGPCVIVRIRGVHTQSFFCSVFCYSHQRARCEFFRWFSCCLLILLTLTYSRNFTRVEKHLLTFAFSRAAPLEKLRKMSVLQCTSVSILSVWFWVWSCGHGCPAELSWESLRSRRSEVSMHMFTHVYEFPHIQAYSSL